MAEIVTFIENEMYVRNFLSSGAFDRLLSRHSVKLSASEAVSPAALEPWAHVCTEGYRRESSNRGRVFAFNKLSIRRFRERSSTFEIKVRTGLPFGPYSLRERIKAAPAVYDRYVAPSLLQRLADNATLESVIAAESPRLAIFVITGVESTGYELIKLSRRHGFRTLFLVNGWDNLSSKTVFGALPDHLGVWGEQAVDDAVSIHGMPRERCHKLGCARYEAYFGDRSRFQSPFEFRYALFAGATTPCDELTPLKAIDAELERQGVADLKIVYRPHPWRDPRKCDDLFRPDEFRHTLLDPQVERDYYGNKRDGLESVSSSAMPTLDYYPRLLNNASFVVSPMSSMSLEAALFDVPSIVLAADDGIHPLPCSLIARFRHFQGARDVPGWKFVDDLQQLPVRLIELERETRCDRPGRRRYAPGLSRAMRSYLFDDGRSYGDRLLDAAERILAREDALQTVPVAGGAH